MRTVLFCLFLGFTTTARAETWHRVAYDNAGTAGKQPHLLRGASYRYSEEDLPTSFTRADSSARTVAFGKAVQFAYAGLASSAKYKLRLVFQSDGYREQRVRLGDVTVLDRVKLSKAPAVIREVAVPSKAIVDGMMVLTVDLLSGPNAVVSEIEVLSTDRVALKQADRSIMISKEDRQTAYELVDKLRPQYVPIPVGGPEPVSLNGTWSFCPTPVEDFFGQTRAGEGWKPIEVPGEWTMQGFTVPANQAAGYWREFEVPKAWVGQRVRIRFDSVYSDCVVWVNGHKVGAHLGGFTPLELDITDVVQAGRNVLALSVKNESLADKLASGSQYAAHVLGGIPRKVRLFALPELHVQSLHVIGALEDSCKDGSAIVQIEVANRGDAEVTGLSVRCAVSSLRGGGKPAKLRRPMEALGVGETFAFDLDLAMRDVLTWHPEHPNLYVARVELMRDDTVIETVEQRFGFRRIEVKGNQLFVNNVPVQLKGVCRHEVHPLRGRSLPEGQWRRDIEVFRAGNVNHIRTSHYPPAEELMEAADELGMFVEAEGPFCWAHGAKGDADATTEATVRQLLELVERDRSHPCIIYWSLANESHWNRHFELASLAARHLDPTRPQTFNFFPWGGATSRPDEGFCEIGSDHYPGPRGPGKFADHIRPVCYGEYCHLNAYNRHELVTDPGVRDAWGRGLAAMWEDMWQSKGTLGGSLWAGIDDTHFVPPDLTVGYGTWGPIDGWRRPKPEYWHMKKAYSPIRVLTKRLKWPVDGETVTVDVENRFDATNLKDVKIEAWFEPDKTKTQAVTADVAPRAKGVLTVPVENSGGEEQVLRLRFTSSLGFVVDEYALPVEPVSRPVPTPAAYHHAARALLNRPGERFYEDTAETITVKTGNRTWTVSRATGQLARDGVLLGGPHLMVLSLNGAGGTQMHGKMPTYAPHTAPCSGWKVASVNGQANDDGVEITIAGDYKEAEGRYALRFDGRGRVTIDYAFTMKQKVNPRQVGLVFDLPKSCDRLAWRRDGLWTIYPVEHIGRLSGSVRAFEGMHVCGPAGPRTVPDWPWSSDGNELGSNDFRSTKENIHWASLVDSKGRGTKVVSDGTQHARAWIEGDRARLLVADYNNPGAERFFRRHASSEDKPLEKGDVVKGCVVIEVGDI